MKKIRVLVIDDSALVRKLLKEILSSDPGIEVCGTAIDAFDARKKIKRLNPDVLTLDVEMPKMDGITFLRNLMRLHPLPVIMISSLTEKGATVTQQALELGALDFVCKPKSDLAENLQDYRDEIIEKVRMAADARISAVGLRQATSEMAPDDRNRGGPQIDDDVLSDALIFIGASTGGTQAIKEVLQQLPHRVPGIVIVQHIPPVFSSHFASRLNTLLSLNVSEAREGQRILPGHVYVAPGDRHLRVARDQGGYYCTLDDGAPVNRHIPSVDVLFRSAVDSAGADAVGVLLTGMGSDGAEGLGAMQRAGAATIAQDEKTSVVWGMPGSAVELGAADQVLPLGGVAKGIVSALQQSGPAQGRAGYRTGS